MIYCRQSPAKAAPVIVSLLLSLGAFGACGQPAEATLILSEAHALEACEEGSCDAAPEDEASAAAQPAAPDEGGWVSRCDNDGECSIGHCVCGVCTRSCDAAPDACAGLPEGATCFGGRTLPRQALCHATTVPGICLSPCSSDEQCGAGLVCALGACLPEPEASAS